MQEQIKVGNIIAKLSSYRGIFSSCCPAISIDVKRVVVYPYYDRTAFSNQPVHTKREVFFFFSSHVIPNLLGQIWMLHLRLRWFPGPYTRILISDAVLSWYSGNNRLSNRAFPIVLHQYRWFARHAVPVHAMSMVLRGDCDRLFAFDLFWGKWCDCISSSS